MNTQELSGKYFVRTTPNGTWEDVTIKFAGIKILTLNGFNEVGDSVNVYNEQWINSEQEDFLISNEDDQGNAKIVRKNVDLSLTFICGERYGALDTQTTYDAFVDYIAKHGDFYIKSIYVNKIAHVICLNGFKPTVEKLHRGDKSYIMATAALHVLEPFASVQ